MNNENQEFREYFEVFSPDAAQSERMYTALTALTPAKRSRAKLHMMPLAALLTALFLSVTAVATAPLTAPLIKRYFFPDTGIVEVTSDSITPLYLIMDLTPGEDESGKIVRRFGYWHDGMAYVWFESETAYITLSYPSLDLGDGKKLTRTGSRRISEDVMVNKYLLTYPVETVDAAETGIPFDDCRFRFNRMPAEYSTYSVEYEEVRLTLIPLTDDKTTFAYELDFTDERKGELSVSIPGLFSDRESSSHLNMFLIDESGRNHRLESHGQLLSVPETPQAEITGFYCKQLSFFCRFDKEILVNLPIPEKGTTLETNIKVPFPDASYTGIVSSVQFRSQEEKIKINPHHEPDYVGEFFTVFTKAITDGNTKIYFKLDHTPEYMKYIFNNSESFMSEKSTRTNFTSGQEGYNPSEQIADFTVPYIPNGESTIPMILSGYNAEITADWSISFTE